MIVAGLGFRSTVSVQDLAEALSGLSPDALATASGKAPALAPLGLPVIAVPEEDLRGVGTLTESSRVRDLFGTGSLSEAAALVAAGPGARLVRKREVRGLVTVALAQSAPASCAAEDQKDQI
ncbi:cobalamin biosynthesis protein [Rhodobacter sp. NSM]|uniref:cobalamin biosynthesis protein n=1 Tax=Rhodobacter sp. NSM TaxID=3457501 RepID=UPI003FD598B9